MFNINRPCGVGSHQKVGNLRERIKPRSIMWITLPPSTLFRARRSGCHESIPSAFPFSKNDNISANLIRPGSFAVFASWKEATISSFSLAANSLFFQIPKRKNHCRGTCPIQRLRAFEGCSPHLWCYFTSSRSSAKRITSAGSLRSFSSSCRRTRRTCSGG